MQITMGLDNGSGFVVHVDFCYGVVFGWNSCGFGGLGGWRRDLCILQPNVV